MPATSGPAEVIKRARITNSNITEKRDGIYYYYIIDLTLEETPYSIDIPSLTMKYIVQNLSGKDEQTGSCSISGRTISVKTKNYLFWSTILQSISVQLTEGFVIQNYNTSSPSLSSVSLSVSDLTPVE